ncbi:hypothetical protein Acr_01g0000530 [Actinidia rufa]|uniref:Haloacid dehalogenase-like hydrolase (HAD) superfamily protein n=1 Tax=Actinidia rufa TaxID=165716 RepID=A0A7J0E161_9ERIC|nr:hypothetical protein Acr_01g0000530 [Actinidia rufa]
MASSRAILLVPPNPSLSSHPSLPPLRTTTIATTRTAARPLAVSASASTLQALIFDCDSFILESENLHRQAYNDAFSHFNIRCPSSSSQPLNWGSDFYDELQNRIGGGKRKT